MNIFINTSGNFFDKNINLRFRWKLDRYEINKEKSGEY